MNFSGEAKRPNPLLSIGGGWHQSMSGCDCQHMVACASVCVLSLAPWKVDLALWSSATFLIIDLFAHTLMVLLQSRLKRAVTCASFNHARSGVNLRNHNCARTFLTCLAIQIRRSVLITVQASAQEGLQLQKAKANHGVLKKRVMKLESIL